jgi:RimJ/RimL family protein N-acetyltransferase
MGDKKFMDKKNDSNKEYFFRGKNIRMRGVQEQDYEVSMYRWANDVEFNQYLSYGLYPATPGTMRNLFSDLMSKENYIFSIDDKSTNQHIGIIGLHNINWQIRSAEYTIHIGEKKYWGTTVAAEATEYILSFAFTSLNMSKIWLGVCEENSRALKFYEKIGFQKEGALRNEIFRNNKYYNSIRMSLLNNEYSQNDRKV